MTTLSDWSYVAAPCRLSASQMLLCTWTVPAELDGPMLLAELHQSLKPGGAVIISDHAAAAGSPPTTGGTTHRIDPAIVVREMEAAGFTLADEAHFLRNPDDDYAKSVFDEDIRGKSDRFVMRFEKR